MKKWLWFLLLYCVGLLGGGGLMLLAEMVSKSLSQQF